VRWSPSAGQFGGFAKLGSGSCQAANLLGNWKRRCADRGRVTADGQLVEGPGRHRLVMFQESALFLWLTAFGNVMFGLKLVPDLSRSARRVTAPRYLRMVGLEGFAHANIQELSGGMRQRVAFARSLAPDPHVLLMDEPLSSLDALTREQLYADIQRIQQDRRKTIVLVTHNGARGGLPGGPGDPAVAGAGAHPRILPDPPAAPARRQQHPARRIHRADHRGAQGLHRTRGGMMSHVSPHFAPSRRHAKVVRRRFGACAMGITMGAMTAGAEIIYAEVEAAVLAEGASIDRPTNQRNSTL